LRHDDDDDDDDVTLTIYRSAAHRDATRRRW
jgi:hypothetical protein